MSRKTYIGFFIALFITLFCDASFAWTGAPPQKAKPDYESVTSNPIQSQVGGLVMQASDTDMIYTAADYAFSKVGKQGTPEQFAKEYAKAKAHLTAVAFSAAFVVAMAEEEKPTDPTSTVYAQAMRNGISSVADAMSDMYDDSSEILALKRQKPSDKFVERYNKARIAKNRAWETTGVQPQAMAGSHMYARVYAAILEDYTKAYYDGGLRVAKIMLKRGY
jgi:hypothetical protein